MARNEQSGGGEKRGRSGKSGNSGNNAKPVGSREAREAREEPAGTSSPDASSSPSSSSSPASWKPETVTITKIVMPGQANARGTLFGGVALAMMDEAAAIVAMRHARSSVVTAHIQSVDFRAPIHQGDAVEVTATLKMVGRTSMRIGVDTWGENLETGERRFCTTAEFVFVAMGGDGKPTAVPPLGAAKA